MRIARVAANWQSPLLIAVFLFMFSMTAVPQAQAQGFKVMRLNPGGSVAAYATGVNSKVQVVGAYTDSASLVHGFEWTGGTYKTINFPKANKYTRALGINDSGEIVGDFFGSDSFYHGYTDIGGKLVQYDVDKGVVSTSIFAVNSKGDFAGAAGAQGFVNIGGTVTEFYGSGTDSTYALGINTSDESVGQYYDSSNNSHGFYRNAAGVITEIIFPGALQTACTGIDDSGEIVGWYVNSSGQYYGFTDVSGVFQSNDFIFVGGVNKAGTLVGAYYGPGATGAQEYGILAIPATFSLITVTVPKAEGTSTIAVNNAGNMVGWYTNATGVQHGMILSGTKVTNIDDPNEIAVGNTYPEGVNTSKQIVGYYLNSANQDQAFLYSSKKFTDIGPADAVFSVAQNINDAGEIMGYYGDSGGGIHAFLDNAGTYTTIDVPGAQYTYGWGINATGKMTLEWYDANDIFESSTYDGTTFTTIDVPGALETSAHAINASGNVVFVWVDYYGNDHGALLNVGSYYVFDDAPGSQLRADGINDTNLIVGRFNPPGTTFFNSFKGTLK